MTPETRFRRTLGCENQNRIPDRSVHMNWSGAHWLVHLLFLRIWFPRHEHVTLCSRSIWQISEHRWSSHWERRWSISRWSSPRESTTTNEVKPRNIGWFQILFWQFLNRKKIRTKLDLAIKWGASSRWSSSLYCPMRDSDEMTIWKMYSTLSFWY